MLYRWLGGCFALILLAASPVLAGDDVPAWLQQAAQQRPAAYDKSVTAVVLLKEANVTVSEDGRMTVTTTYAVRVLTREGREEAVAAEPYDTASGKVRELRAWLIRPNGSVKRYGKDETLDLAVSPNDVYNEGRVKLISAEDEADAGMVFGYQSVTETRSDSNQDRWDFQDNLPTLLSRYTLTLPSNWRATSVTFNHSPVEPVTSGQTFTWELRNLPAIEEEPASPSIKNLAPRLAVNYAPPAGASSVIPSYSNWVEVSRWYSQLSDPQASADDAIAARARSLTASARTELEKIQAIGRFVQNLQYISIQIGVGRFRPHSAAEVFSKAYGDCKDKANLMRAMLKAIGITSYPVLIYSGDPTFVRQEWASPRQFNHCIIAIKLNEDGTRVPTVIEHPTLGRLLIFDATDEDTPVGDLPEHEQGSFALIAAGDAGALMRMPTTPPEANRMERRTEVTLTPEGSITATLSERSIGQSAVGERRAFRHLARPEYNKYIEAWIGRGASGAKLSKIEPTDGGDGRFALDVEFTAGRYAQLMQERLLVFKPAIVSRSEALFLTKPTRTHPVILDSQAFNEIVRIKLPTGFEVDELPDPLKLDTPFGTYISAYEVKDGQLLFTRSFTQKAATIPVEQYAAVRSFYERIRAAEQSPVVLAKK